MTGMFTGEGAELLLEALRQPATLLELAGACRRGPASVARSLVGLLGTGQAVAYCRDHYIRSDLLASFQDTPGKLEWSASRKVMAALGTKRCRASELSRRTGLSEEGVTTELRGLGSIGAVSPVRRGSVPLWCRDGRGSDIPARRRRVVHMVACSAMLTLLTEPRRSIEVARALGCCGAMTNDLLQGLLHAGRISRVRSGVYVVASGSQPSQPHTMMPTRYVNGMRPQPIRDAILAFLVQPRQAFNIAREVGRTVPNVTGHLRAMLTLGLVERVAYGRYARPGTPGLPPPDQRCLQRPRSTAPTVRT